jgi:hypothetical protein
MNQATTSRRDWDEADIGSGEKSPGQQETEEMIRQIPALPDTSATQEPLASHDGLDARQ